ncbi:MAG: hypothetical protein IKW95_00005 [Lachnospiraceae bacterium]|nr:hypothetical protein [Lachnospiraceae bacterium]
MNREKLLNAIGQTDESLLKDNEELRRRPENSSVTKEAPFTAKKGRARRRVVFALAACLVLALGSIAAYASGIFRSGSVTTGTNENGHATYFYEPDEDMRLPSSVFTGAFMTEVPGYFHEYWQRSQGVTFSYPDRRNGVRGFDIDFTDVPFLHAQEFNTLEDAAAYIGYSPLAIPAFELNLEKDWVNVSVLGLDDNWIPGTDIEPDFKVGCVELNARYLLDDLVVHLVDYMITDIYATPRAIQEVSSESSTFTSETVVANNREFQVITEDISSFLPGYIEKQYIWAQDKVEYHLIIRYRNKEAEIEKAETLIRNWMDSFGN